jgi:hypothetical protein
VAYTGTLRYPLSAYLDPINWARWDGKRDTAALVHQLRQAIAGADLPDRGSANGGGDRAVLAPPASAQPATLELPGGTMDPESAFYIERDSDRVALDLVGLPGITLTIKAPRQMGKSSLLLRTLQAAGRAGKRIAFLDFQLLDRSTLRDADAFFRQFCAWFSAELGADDRHQEVWATPLGNVLRCTNYVRDHLLRSQDSVVLALDEVETVFDSAFRSDFFGMLRSWHNARRAQSPWKRLDLVLVTSTEPHQFILNPTQSPFNVGESLALADFTPAQAAELNRRHGSPLGPAELARLDELLAGHPFLTRRALYLVAGGRMDVTALFARAADESGPFGDHLCHYLLRLQAQAGLLRAVAECLSKRQCKDERLLALLLGTGLVRRDGAGLAPRCRLYDDFFRDRLHA